MKPLRIRQIAFIPSRPVAHQRGVALIIGLVILVILALLGTTAYSVATQDERIAGNSRDRGRARDAAEAMLRECERVVRNGAPTFDSAGGSVTPNGATTTAKGGMYAAPAPGAPWQGEAVDWSKLTPYTMPSAVTNQIATQDPSFAKQATPQCVAEQYVLNPADLNNGITPKGVAQSKLIPTSIVHISARGYGLNSNTQVTLVTDIEL
jgi:type IV pilus assembly protein PilX